MLETALFDYDLPDGFIARYPAEKRDGSRMMALERDSGETAIREFPDIVEYLEPGDAVTVNGRTILILGREIWPAGSINWDIYDAIGWDKVVFQTCFGDDEIWIAYGIPVHPSEEFLAAHPPQWQTGE